MPNQSAKELNRAAKQLRRAAKAFGHQEPLITPPTTPQLPPGPVDCACVIHGTGYNWTYVDRLYSMLSRHISRGIRLHVYTEPGRPVPPHMIRHDLQEWPGVSGRKQSWWYKMQLFNPAHHQGQLLYFDLDTVVVNNLDWIIDLSTSYFWTIRDFKSLWKPHVQSMNSSVMYWDTVAWGNIWTEFEKQGVNKIQSSYRGGDQDYLNSVISPKQRRFFEDGRAVSWRWTALNGGMNFRNRTYRLPARGTTIAPENSLLIFHGDPKPHETPDPVIKQHWC